MIPFAAWRPDEAILGNPYAADVRNVLPAAVRDDGSIIWRPFPEFEASTDAASEAVLSAKGFVLPDGSVRAVLGTATKLYMISASDGTLVDVSGTTYSANANARWSFEVYGDNLIATNINDGPQRFIVGTDTDFSDLAGTPTHGHLVSIWKDQLVFGALSGNLEAVQWSEINDITDYTGGNSDIQVFPGYGRVMAISRGNTPMIVQEQGIQRGIFTGTATVFEFDNLTEDFGCRIPHATAFRRNRAFFWSDEGFKAVSAGGEIQSIGFRKIDAWASKNINFKQPFVAAADPVRPIIYWGGTSADSGETSMNTLLAYSMDLGEWSRIDIDLETVLAWQQPAVTLDGLDSISGSLDALVFSLDSSVWRSDFPVIGGVDRSHTAGQFAGQNKQATMYTAEVQFAERRARLKTVRPIIDAGASLIWQGRDSRETGYLQRLEAQPTFGRDQRVRINRKARFHKLSLTTGSPNWTLASGVDEEVA